MADDMQLSRNPHTITRWILKEQQKYPNAKGDLTIILNSITLAIKIISAAAKGAGIFQQYGLHEPEKDDAALYSFAALPNVEEEEEKKDSDDSKKKEEKKKGGIREFAQETIISALSWCGKVSMILSTVNLSEPIFVKKCDEPRYCVVFDPVDGKQNIEINASIGTIFGIYKVKDPSNPNKKDLLQSGLNMICSGYALYGDATVVMLTFGDDVNGFTLDPTIGEFVLTHINVKIPEVGSIYSINEGYAEEWDEATKDYVSRCKKPDKGKPKKQRYIGCMVADVHRALIKGGIYLYPTTKKFPNGKLSLQCECNPLAFLIAAAGGRASNGTDPILHIEPKTVDATTPIFIGSKREVMSVDGCYKRHKK
eukprot:554190_1